MESWDQVIPLYADMTLLLVFLLLTRDSEKRY